MTPENPEHHESTGDAGSHAHAGALQDHRPRPRGVLPRQLQMWLMAGIALVILAIIFATGHSAPPRRTPPAETVAAPALAAADRIRSYQQQLAAEEARQRQILAQQSVAARAAEAMPVAVAPASDPIADEQRRREYQSLFADSVSLSLRRAGRLPTAESPQPKQASSGSPSIPSPEQVAPLQVGTHAPATSAARGESTQDPRSSAPMSATTPVTAHAPAPPDRPDPPDPTNPPHLSARPDAPGPPDRVRPREENPASGPRLRVLEGTVIETALLNRLDGTFSGPVTCLVTTPVYSFDRQQVLIPSGARVIGAASSVQSWGDSRLAVSFHRLVMPDGHTYSLDAFKGLDHIGETGLRDSVNRHYLQVFGASVAIGALSGLAQYQTRGGLDTSGVGDAYRQASGSSLATSAGRVLDRYLNVLPTVTIHEGYRIKVYLTNDLDLPAYSAGETWEGVR